MNEDTALSLLVWAVCVVGLSAIGLILWALLEVMP